MNLDDLVTRHQIDAEHAGSAPFDHYYDMLVPGNNDTQIEENQDLSCFSIRSLGMDGENGATEDLIHICDPETFIEALVHFQRLRASDPRYASHPDREKWLAATFSYGES